MAKAGKFDFAPITSWRIWGRLALDDTWVRYRRSIIGPAWIAIAQGVWIFGVYFLKDIFGQHAEGSYLMYLACGIVVFSLISIAITDAPVALQRSAGLMLNYPIPPSIFIMRASASAILTFVHSLPVLVVVAFVAPWTPTWSALMALPGLLVLLVAVVGIYFALAALGVRFYDIGVAAGSVSALLFLLSPVLWVPSEALLASPIIYANPIYHMIEAIRGPLMGAAFNPTHLVVSGLTALVCLAAGIGLYAGGRKELATWL